MKKIFKSAQLAILGLIILLFLSCSAFANGYLLLDTGYRYDRINQSFEFLDSTDITFYASDQNNFENLQSYQIGARGLWCYCPFLIKASGHYIWMFGDGSNYNEQYLVKADASGHGADASAGIGITIPVCGCFEIVPLVGGSYDVQRLVIRDARSSLPGAPVEPTNGTKWKSEWYGPWAGADIYFNTFKCLPLNFNAGYEFHYGWSNIHFKPKANHPEFLFFEYKTHLHHVTGNVFHIQGLYCFCKHLVFGIHLQYTIWSNHHKMRQKIPPPAESGLTATQFTRTLTLTWRSFSATANLGFCF